MRARGSSHLQAVRTVGPPIGLGGFFLSFPKTKKTVGPPPHCLKTLRSLVGPPPFSAEGTVGPPRKPWVLLHRKQGEPWALGKKSNRGSFPLSSVTHTHTPVHHAPHPAPQGRPPTRGSSSRGEYEPWALPYGKQGEPWVTGGLVADVVGSTEFTMAPCKFLGARVCYYEGERGSREQVSG